MSLPKKCDMCGSTIDDGECSCGTWVSENELPQERKIFRDSLAAFHDMKIMMLSGDAPHLGVAYVFFRGDYNDCLEVKEFIKRLKRRPHYDEKE